MRKPKRVTADARLGMGRRYMASALLFCPAGPLQPVQAFLLKVCRVIPKHLRPDYRRFWALSAIGGGIGEGLIMGFWEGTENMVNCAARFPRQTLLECIKSGCNGLERGRCS